VLKTPSDVCQDVPERERARTEESWTRMARATVSGRFRALGAGRSDLTGNGCQTLASEFTILTRGAEA